MATGRKLNPDIFKELNFIHRPNLIQDSYEFIIEDTVYESEFLGDSKVYHYKSMSVSWCNDKGLGEYYLFLREGSTDKRHEDEVVTLTRELLYEDDLKDFIRLIK